MAIEAGADFLGFNFFPRSPRFLLPDEAARLRRGVPSHVGCVGVFVNSTREEVAATARTVGLDVLQFHGDETPEFCRGWDRPTIRALRLRGPAAAAAAATFATTWILADAFVEGEYGGTGRRVDPAWLTGLERERLFLAGGLDVENVADAVRQVRPYAVDVASGVESSPGRKDPDKMRRFIAHVQSA